MPHGGSYRADSFSSNLEAEILRLNAQVDLFWPMESALFPRLGLQDGMRVLDCGCGPGRLLELLKQRFPALKCVGVEADRILAEACRKRIEECGLSDCLIVEGTAENPGLQPESFDVVILRLVLEHLTDPLAALRALSALLRPGGRLIVISNDFEFHLRAYPPVPELERLYKAYCASRRKDGGDPCIGRRVPQLLQQADLNLVACEMELAHSVELGDTPFLKAEGAGIPTQLVKSGFFDEKTLEEMTRSWRAMLSAPEHCITRPLWVAAGERPTGTAAKRRGGSAVAGSSAVLKAPSGAGTLGMLLGFLAETLESKSVGQDDSLAALGIDSLSAIRLQERIKGLTKVEIPIIRFFEDGSVRALADFLESRMESRGFDAGESAKSSGKARRWVEGEL